MRTRTVVLLAVTAVAGDAVEAASRSSAAAEMCRTIALVRTIGVVGCWFLLSLTLSLPSSLFSSLSASASSSSCSCEELRAQFNTNG